MLEKLIFLPKKCIYVMTYRNEHPVHILQSDYDIETIRQMYEP